MSTRKRIIEAATRLYAERGYTGMTMKEIAKEVGIKAPSLYAFYENKGEIVLHIYQQTLQQHLQLAVNDDETKQDRSVKEQLDELIHAIMNFQLRESMQMKIYIRLLLFPPDVFEVDLKKELLVLEEKEHEMFSRLFKKAMENKEIGQGDEQAIASLFICILDGLFWQMQRMEEMVFRERYPVIWEQFWLGLK